MSVGSASIPAGTRRRRVFGGIASFQMLAMFRRGLFYSYLSIYLRHFLGLSVTETTLFATGPMVMNIIFQTFVWGPFSDRRQLRRTLIIWGEALAGIGTLLVWYAHTLPADKSAAGYVVIAGLSLVEIFWSMSNIGWSALISDIYGQKERSTVQGRLLSVGGIGRILGVWIGGTLYDGLQLQYAGWGFYQGALFFVAAGAMFISILPLLFTPEGGIGVAERQAVKAPRGDGGASSAVFIIFLVAMTFNNFGRNSIAVIQTQYLVLESGFAVSSKALSYIVNTQSLAMILAGMAAGWIGRRWGDANALMAATALAVASLVIIAVTDDLRLVYLSNFFRGCSEVVISAASYAFAAQLIPPQRRARLFSLFNATFFLSWGMAGTLIAGPVADILMARGAANNFAYRMSFVSAAVLTLVGLLIHIYLIYYYIPGHRGSGGTGPHSVAP